MVGGESVARKINIRNNKALILILLIFLRVSFTWRSQRLFDAKISLQTKRKHMTTSIKSLLICTFVTWEQKRNVMRDNAYATKIIHLVGRIIKLILNRYQIS
jgi:hypothetical protein